MIEVIDRTEDEITLQIKIKLKGSFSDMEESIQQAVNELGAEASKEALEKFDTTGAAIQMDNLRLSSKGKVIKRYETPYGAIDIGRHVYQTSTGGKTYCPLDEKARIVMSSTPHFAQIIVHKYTGSSAREVSEDFEKNHGRSVSRCFIQTMVDAIGGLAQAIEENWMYEIPQQEGIVDTIALSLDGTCILMRKEGYREAMAGTISLYNKVGERLHSIYLGASPEYGKQKFLDRLEREIYSVKLQYPNAKYVGIADGAKINWEFLEKHTAYQVLDFYHATEYLSNVSHAVHPHFSSNIKRKFWLDEACHRLKHDKNSAEDLLKEMMQLPQDELTIDTRSKLNAAITYFKNQKHRMNYDYYRGMNLPIGSGVTEAACKTLVKQRLCQSGMKWGEKGARLLLCLRALLCTPGRFEQFWERINLAGFSGLIEVH